MSNNDETLKSLKVTGNGIIRQITYELLWAFALQQLWSYLLLFLS